MPSDESATTSVPNAAKTPTDTATGTTDTTVPRRSGGAGPHRPLAVVTGASRGLGRALASGLAAAGWDLVLDARHGEDLLAAADDLAPAATVTIRVGDVTDADHRADLAAAVADLGPVDLLVNNASALGPSPLPRLADLDPDQFAAVLATNTVAPIALFQALLPHLSPTATILNISSDAAIGAWEGWGGYGASKAALDHASAVLAVEHPDLTIHAVDPGDLRTDMHQAAFPGEDIGDRPEPATVVPHLLALVAADLPSGRHRARDVDPATGVVREDAA